MEVRRTNSKKMEKDVKKRLGIRRTNRKNMEKGEIKAG